MKIKYVSIVKNNKVVDAAVYGYVAHVGLSGIPSEAWNKYFYYKCRRGSTIRKNKIKINGNELILNIEKEGNIQDHIDIIKTIVDEANRLEMRYRSDCNGLKVIDA